MDAVLFDFDGTLIDSTGTIMRCLNQVLKNHGLETFPDDALPILIGKSLEKIFAHKTAEPELLCEMADEYRQIQTATFAEDTKIFEFTVPMLEECTRAGYKLALFTLRHTEPAKAVVSGLGLDKYFMAVVGTDTARREKPHPDHVLVTARLIGAAPERCIAVGDTKFDVMSGNGAGALTVGVNWGVGTTRELADADADYIVTDGSQLLELLLALKDE